MREKLNAAKSAVSNVKVENGTVDGQSLSSALSAVNALASVCLEKDTEVSGILADNLQWKLRPLKRIAHLCASVEGHLSKVAEGNTSGLEKAVRILSDQVEQNMAAFEEQGL